MVNKKDVLVAKLIDEYEVVLTLGAEDGAKKGDKFLVYGLGDEIFDPASKASLGRIEMVRGTVVLKHIQPKMSVARSAEVTIIPGTKRIIKRDGIIYSFQGPTREEVEEESRTEIKSLKNPKVGDFARPI